MWSSSPWSTLTTGQKSTPLPDVIASSIRQHGQHQEPSLALVWALTPQGLFQHRHLGKHRAVS